MLKRDQRPTNVDYYRRNRLLELQRVRVRQAGTVEMLREWRQVPCADCGGRFEPFQMEFDHRDPATKSFNLMTGRAMLMSTARLRDEAAKCDVVCSNCHRVRTARSWIGRQRKHKYDTPSRARKMARWNERSDLLTRLRDVPCADCGSRFPSPAMDFDHRDPAMKRFTVSRMRAMGTLEELAAEVEKCDVVCANCHQLRTYRRRETRLFERE